MWFLLQKLLLHKRPGYLLRLDPKGFLALNSTAPQFDVELTFVDVAENRPFLLNDSIYLAMCMWVTRIIRLRSPVSSQQLQYRGTGRKLRATYGKLG